MKYLVLILKQDRILSINSEIGWNTQYFHPAREGSKLVFRLYGFVYKK